MKKSLVLLFAVAFFFGVISSASASPFSYTNDTDHAIRNHQWTGSSINVTGAAGTITDLNVNIVIDHTFLADLEIHLDHWADGQFWSWIMNDDGGGWNNMDVNFDDEAALSIDGYNPGHNDLTGTFRPEASLSMYDGYSLNGVWRLSIYDDAWGDTGYLREWSIYGDDSTAPVPEPATLLLLGSGLAGLAFYRRKRK